MATSALNAFQLAWPADPNEMKLKLKYRTKQAGNKGTSKRNNSGGQGKKPGCVVSSRTSPDQYGRWAAQMKAAGEPILG